MRLLKLSLLLAMASTFCNGTVHEDCPPTSSPAPTESPAPSPSPSEAPTDTQVPTATVHPSVAPTNLPSTSPPSPAPTTEPTESPAPSPSPSEAPTTFAPTLSSKPSISRAPSSAPSEIPSLAPSASPSEYPSASPTRAPTTKPTRTPEPSPLPSQSPTDSPTVSPTKAPTTAPSEVPSSKPSYSPTASPTTSPPTTYPSAKPTMTTRPTSTFAPSDKPSQSPTKTPTKSPSATPSVLPTISTHPSAFPSTSPTDSPTASSQPSLFPSALPSTGPSISPAPSNGPVGFAATGLVVAFEGAIAVLSTENVLAFEATLVDYLQDNIRNIPDVAAIEFTHTEVTDQDIASGRRQLKTARRSLNGSSLEITLSVFALVLLEEEGVFDFKTLLEIFFADADRLLELRRILESLGVFVFLEQEAPRTSSDSGGIIGSNTGNQSQDSTPIPMLGAIAGILLSAMGSSAIYLWMRGRREDGYPVPKLEPTASSVDSYDEESEPRIYIKDSQSTDWISQKHDEPESDHLQHCPDLEMVSPTGSVDSTIAPSGLSYYRPTLLSMESNIEVPETPKTDYEPSLCSPKTDPQPTEFVFDTTTSVPSAGVMSNEAPKIKPSVSSVTSFFSPRLLGTWKKGKNSHDANDSRQENPNPQQQQLAPMQNGSQRSSSYPKSTSISPKRSPIRRNILRHDVCADVDAVNGENVSSGRDSPVQSSAETSIQVMNEVAYLFLQKGRPDPEESLQRDQGFSARSIQRMNSKGTINGAVVDHTGHVGTLAPNTRKRSNSYYFSDDESA